MSHAITRRSLLKQVAIVGASGMALPYVVRPSALGKAGAVAASNRITVGFIGTGTLRQLPFAMSIRKISTSRGKWSIRSTAIPIVLLTVTFGMFWRETTSMR